MDTALSAQIARREAVISKIKQVLIQNHYVNSAPETLDLDAPLFGSGLALDSTDALDLAAATEAAFGLTFPKESLSAGLWTINSLTDLILERQDAEEVA